jgi:hypothetical protein
MRVMPKVSHPLCFLLTVTINLGAAASGKSAMKMTEQQVDALIASANFKRVKSKSDFPEPFAASMNLDGVSDINGPFSSDCTGSEPHSRLVCGAVSKKYALTIEEQGGFAYFQEFKLYELVNNKVEFVYSEMPSPKRITEIESKLGK